MAKAILRFCHTARALEEVEKPWYAEWGVYGDKGRIRREGPYRTEAEAKMKVNALKVIHQLLPLRQQVELSTDIAMVAE